MTELISFGYIRIGLSGSDLFLDISKLPTTQQLNKIYKIINENYCNVILELKNGLGEYRKDLEFYTNITSKSYNYNSPVNSYKVINDIVKYFEGIKENKMSKNINWYKTTKNTKENYNVYLPELDWYNVAKFIKASKELEFFDLEKNDLTKEAGVLNQAISGALLWAAMLVLNGVSETIASEITKVPVNKVTEVMKNPAQVAIAKNVATTKQNKIEDIKKQIGQKQQEQQKQNINLYTIVQKVLDHENLDPKQTPFRITSPTMKKWNSIYGFKIDKKFVPPHDKRKFLYLQNPADVSKAVTVLFKNYAENPDKYGFSSEPTLKQALEKFDQSGCKGKIDFLQRNIKGLNINKKLKDFIS